ncbi:MAG: 50S ribosomal protein L11 methyltransferase [Proteobacteria bacterium]|nr:50S ribosomal protein L11 methyltransferase [Pseudomonadota bacterium]
MPFLELTLRSTQREHPRIEAALDELGALAVTFMDADAQTPDEHAILEPGVGAMPLWQALQLTALFADDADADGLLYALEVLVPEADLASAQFRQVPDQDWVRAWMDDYPPLRFGPSLWIVPWNAEIPPDAVAQGAAATLVRLDPGLAFGSGTHATTALCLQWLESLAARGIVQEKTVLDVGCGSGILAIAALKLGAAHADGIDNDPQALLASADNAQRNEVAERLSVFTPIAAPDARYDIVLANILASALVELAESIAARVRPGGLLALSGILHGQQDELLARYGAWFDDLAVTRQGDWVRIDGVRRHAALAPDDPVR